MLILKHGTNERIERLSKLTGEIARRGPHHRPGNVLSAAEELQIVSVLRSARYAHLSRATASGFREWPTHPKRRDNYLDTHRRNKSLPMIPEWTLVLLVGVSRFALFLLFRCGSACDSVVNWP